MSDADRLYRWAREQQCDQRWQHYAEKWVAVDRVASWQDKVLRMGKVPRFTAWRSQVLNGLVFPVQRGDDGLLMRKQPLQDFQREILK